MSKRKAGLLALIAAVILLISGVQVFRGVKGAQAQRLIERGEFEVARSIYEHLHDKRGAAHCNELILESTYQAACALLDGGDYAAAEKIFETMPDYKDAKDKLSACDFLRAESLADEGYYIEARKVLLTLGGYADAGALLERVNAVIFSQAEALARQFKLEEACALWRELGSYGGSAIMLERGRRALEFSQYTGAGRLTDEAKRYACDKDTVRVYKNDGCYIVVPKECRSDTTFFIYYPGGRNEELYIDYFLYYLMNPAPNTLAVFMRKNGIENMEAKCNEAIELLERAAAENGLFVDEIVQGGSSLGAYPAMHGGIYSETNYRIKTTCVLSLDAGADWLEAPLLLTQSECETAAALGIDFYLFESPWVGMNRDGIIRMVNAGDSVTMVGCTFDDHTRITLDAMGMGVVNWACGDRAEIINPGIYTFTKLEPETQKGS